MPEACPAKRANRTIAEQLWSESTFAFRASILLHGAQHVTKKPVETQSNGRGDFEGAEDANDGRGSAEVMAVYAQKSFML